MELQTKFPDYGWYRPLGFSAKRHLWIRDQSPVVASFYESGCKAYSMGWPGDGRMQAGVPDVETDCRACIRAYWRRHAILSATPTPSPNAPATT